MPHTQILVGEFQVIADQVNRYSFQVRTKKLIYTGCCPYCGKGLKNSAFTQHAYRKRKFYVICNHWVHTINGCLPRWKCSACCRTFTQYPSFCSPHRRYTLPQLHLLLNDYCSSKQSSYRRSSMHGSTPIFHHTPLLLNEKISNPSLTSDFVLIFSHTTLYRFHRVCNTHCHLNMYNPVDKYKKKENN
jgi:hypothetical protein